MSTSVTLSTISHADWSLGYLLSVTFAHFKISVGASTHWLHEGVLGCTDVLR